MSLDKKHIDEMYKLSLVESAIDFTYSALESKVDVVYSNLSIVDSVQNSKLDNIAEMVSALSAIDISEIESRVEHIQSDVDALKYDVSVGFSVTESKLDAADLSVSAIESKIDGPVTSHLQHVQSDVDALKIDVSHIVAQQDVGYIVSVASSKTLSHIDSDINNLLLDASALESKIDGPVSSHLIHIHSDVDTAKSDIHGILTAVSVISSGVYHTKSDVEAVKSEVRHIKGNVDYLLSDVSDVESKLDGWVYSNLVNVKDDTEHLPSWIQGIKDDLATGGTSVAISEVESKIEGPVYSQLQGIKDDVALGIANDSLAVSAVESKLDAHLPLLSIHMDVALNDLSAIESKLDYNLPSVFKGGFWLPVPIATWYQVSEIESKIEGSIYSYLTGIKVDVSEAKSDVETLLGYVTQSVASSYAVRTVDSLLDSIFDLQEAGGTLKLTGAEQDLYVNAAPAGNYILNRVLVDLTNMAPSAATTYDSVIIREYVRIKSGGAYVLAYSELFVGSQILPLQIWPRDADGVFEIPNRYGQHIAILQTGNAIAGSFITVDYEYFTYS